MDSGICAKFTDRFEIIVGTQNEILEVLRGEYSHYIEQTVGYLEKKQGF